MSAELYEALIFHGHDLTAFYNEIPKSKLPKVIGGDCDELVLSPDLIALGDKKLTDYWNKYPAQPPIS